MLVTLEQIPLRETLHFLGWRGTPLDETLLAQLREVTALVLREVQPRIVMRRFELKEDGSLKGTNFLPGGQDVQAMLAPCSAAVLLAGTLGAESERLLLRIQAQDAARALLLDAALSAAIEEALDRQEGMLRRELAADGLYLTDRFSPGYGDMPLVQTKMICEVLGAQRAIGLTVSKSGIMMPRKSVTAIMGISASELPRRAKGCDTCSARDTCALRRRE